MPFLQLPGVRVHVEDEGPRDGRGTVLFMHGLLWSNWMFDAQVAALRERYRCVRFDWRGQGQTEVTRSGYDMETLTGDALALIAALSLGPVHLVGLSMGGFVAMRIAARRPELARSMILLETSADPEPEANVPRYRLLANVARHLSVRLVAGRVMPIMFGRSFLEDPARAADREVCRARLLANHRVGIYRAVQGVITRAPVHHELPKVRCPSLVMVGEEDVATVPAKAERIAAQIDGARLVRLPRAGHTSTVENPAAVNAALTGFLDAL